MRKGSKFKIASISKTFTGALIALAKQAGKLSARDLVSTHLPDLSPQFKDITILQLLQHTSGLPHNEAIPNYWQEKSRLALNTEAVIAEINRLELLFSPGEQMKYSSLGYFLLATVLEKVYDKPYQEILYENIYKRLDMRSSGSANSLKIVQGISSGYHMMPNDSVVVAPYRNYSMLKGAGDQISTAEDLLKWNNSFIKNKIFDDYEQEEILNKKTLSKPYGYGWYTDYKSEKQKYYHGGGTWGFSSYNAFYPASGLSIIILSNLSTLPVNAIADQIEKILSGEKLSLISKTQEVQAPSFSLDTYTGVYTSASGQMKLSVISQKGQLFAQLQGNPPFIITSMGEHKFLGKKIDIELDFKTNDDLVIGIIAKRMGRKFEFKKQ